MKKCSAASIALFSVFCAFNAVHAAGYSYASLNYPNASSTYASGINDAGTVVGFSGAVGNSKGFSLGNGTYTPVNYPSDYSTEAHGINNAGTIVGLYEGSGLNNGFSLSGTTYTPIIYSSAPGYTTSVYGINNAGTVVGWYCLNGGQNYGFSMSIGGGSPTTINPAGARKSRAAGINDSGMIVGYYKDTSGEMHGFSLTGETYATLDYPGASATQALGINNAGTIVGTYMDASGKMHGFSLTGGSYTTVDYPGASATEAAGINNGGTIVGTYADSSGNYHGFMTMPATALASGWNLISLPAQPADSSIASVLSSIAGSYQVVWAYNGQAWQVYDPSDPGGSTLTTMQAGNGYWIKMTEKNTLPVSGTVPPSSVTLLPGWNLVGYNGASCAAASSALSGLANNFQVLWGYPSQAWASYDPVNGALPSGFLLCPGAGYWIDVSSAAPWTLPVSSGVSGTVAVGSPISNATVGLVDSTGKTLSGTTASDGSFTIFGTAGLTPPFMLKVASGSTNLYSVSGDSNTSTTINVTPLTDMIVRSWCGAQGTTVDSVFASPATSSLPNPTDVFALGTTVTSMVQPWLVAQGVNTASFNPISTSFQAGTGTGIDAVIGLTTDSASGGTITAVINPNPSTQNPTTQNITITPSVGSGLTITSTPTTVQGAGTPTAMTVAVPTNQTQQGALAGIFATLTNFGNTVNSQGVNLQASDIAPYVDPNYLNDGEVGTYFETSAASFFSSGQTLSFTGLQIGSLDTTNNVANVTFQVAQGGISNTVDLVFKLVGGSWLISGDQQEAATQVTTEAWNWGHNYSSENQPFQYTQTTKLVVDDVQNIVLSATVSGPGITNGPASVPMVCANDNTNSLPACGNSHGSSDTKRYFELDQSFWPAVGAQYVFTLTTTSGGPYQYTATVGNRYGFATDGVTPVPADYPLVALTGSSASLTFNKLLSGNPTVVTGTVYVPIWSYAGTDQLHFNLQGPGGQSNSVSNIDIDGTWTGTPVPGQTNAFTMTIPAITGMTLLNPCPETGEGTTCYQVTFDNQTGDIQQAGGIGFNANDHISSFTNAGVQIVPAVQGD